MTYLDKILQGDCLETLKTLPDGIVNTCVTSPPYYGLRDYGCEGQIGLEETPQEYVNKLVAVFREVKRVLRDDGTLWLNLGDSYSGSGKGQTQEGCADPKNTKTIGMKLNNKNDSGLKPKDLMGIPWRVAVLTVTTKPCSLAHFATFPEDLILPCVLAGCPPQGTVLDPFSGSGTTSLVAKKNGCHYIGCELNPRYIEISDKRLSQGYLFI